MLLPSCARATGSSVRAAVMHKATTANSGGCQDGQCDTIEPGSSSHWRTGGHSVSSPVPLLLPLPRSPASELLIHATRTRSSRKELAQTLAASRTPPRSLSPSSRPSCAAPPIAGTCPITAGANDGRHSRAIADAAVRVGLDRREGESSHGSLDRAGVTPPVVALGLNIEGTSAIAAAVAVAAAVAAAAAAAVEEGSYTSRRRRAKCTALTVIARATSSGCGGVADGDVVDMPSATRVVSSNQRRTRWRGNKKNRRGPQK